MNFIENKASSGFIALLISALSSTCADANSLQERMASPRPPISPMMVTPFAPLAESWNPIDGLHMGTDCVDQALPESLNEESHRSHRYLLLHSVIGLGE